MNGEYPILRYYARKVMIAWGWKTTFGMTASQDENKAHSSISSKNDTEGQASEGEIIKVSFRSIVLLKID